MNPTIDRLSPFLVMEVLEEAQRLERDGIDVVHLEIGEPDFPVPSCVSAAAKGAYDQARTHYTHSLGDPELRAAIAAFYRAEYGVSVDPDCILVTSGSSPAILLTLLTLCAPGDEVVLTDPGYPCYRNFALTCQAVPRMVRVSAEARFQLDPKAVARVANSRTRAVFVNSPMNPAGLLAEDWVYEGLAELGIPIVSDEIYHGLVYKGRARCVLEFTDNAFVLNGFSKRFAMTGLRLGYVIAPKKYVRAMQILQQNLFICAPSIAQRAGIAALREADPEVRRMRGIYDERRRYLVERVKALGFGLTAEPEGAFYVFADARRWTDDVYRFAFDLLREAHVGVTPGVDFGAAGEGFVRFSYATDLARIREGCNRLEAYLRNLRR